MADQTPGSPGNDPLGDRLRATFAAERDDIERRNAGGGIPTPRKGFTMWAPLAVAAAVIALAGFFFLGNQPADQAVELDIAAQPGQGGSDQSPTDEGSLPTEAGPPTDAAPATDPGEIPFLTGVDLCPGRFDPNLTVAWGAGGAVPVAVSPIVGQDPALSRTLESGTAVTLTGGCTAGRTDDDEIWTWFEIAGPANDWIRTEFLVTPQEYDDLRSQLEGQAAEPEVAATANECGREIVPGSEHFVWDIALDDPDGGLVAHTQAGVDAPVTRILKLDEVVTATGGCIVLQSGSSWLELTAPDGSTDWVSGRYLTAVKSACLVGEQYGTLVPEQDPALTSYQLLGPVDGAAVFGQTHVAFAAAGEPVYRWYPLDAVRIAESCYSTGPTGPVCLVGTIQVIDPRSPEPEFAAQGSVEAERTGRVIPAFGARAIHDLVEVTVTIGDGTTRTGLVDPTQTGFAESPCSTNAATLDSLTARPCAINDTTPLESSGSIGTPDSDADHIHNIRTEWSQNCIRAVIELGAGVWTDGDGPAQLLPEITSTKTATATTVRFALCDSAIVDECAIVGSGEREPQRVDFAGGSVFIGIDADRQVYVTMLHDFGQSSVTFINSPARIIIDWQPDASDANSLTDPIVGRYAIFPDGLASFQPGETIRGLARPFEAQGNFYVFDATGDAAAPLSDPATAIAQGRYMAAGWTVGWGEFTAELPELPDGEYVIAFGEGPPGGDLAWVGSGALVSVSGDQATPIAAIDPIELSEPITLNE